MGYLREPSNGKATSSNAKARAERRSSGYSSSGSLHSKPTGVKKHQHRSNKRAARRLREYVHNELRLRGGFIGELAPFILHIARLLAQSAISSKTEAVMEEAFRKAGKSFLFQHFKKLGQVLGPLQQVLELLDLWERATADFPGMPKVPEVAPEKPSVVIKPDDWLDIVKMLKGSGLLVGAAEAVKEFGTKAGSVLDVPSTVIEKLSSQPGRLSAAISMLGIELGDLAPYAAFGAVAMVLVLTGAVVGNKLWQAIRGDLEKQEPTAEDLLTATEPGNILSDITANLGVNEAPAEDELKIKEKKLQELGKRLDRRRNQISRMLQDVEKESQKLATDREKRTQKVSSLLENLAQELAVAGGEGVQAKEDSPDLWSLISKAAKKKAAKKNPEGPKLLNVRRVPSCPHELHAGVWECLAFACLVPCSQCGVALGQALGKGPHGTFVCTECSGGKKVSQKGKTRKIPACPNGQHDGIVDCLANKCLDPCASCRVSLFKSTKKGPVVCLKCRIEQAGLEKPSEGKSGKKRKSSDEDESEDDNIPKKKTKHGTKSKTPKSKAPKAKSPKTNYPDMVKLYPMLSNWGQKWQGDE
ncbi:hypothetical protein F4809DRAFT_646099 [Biscogniauxia mediterranea]|nr:hypothetical protein F4809DRAFT_646099 [Biscogniauxia mediterranea]